MASEDQAAFELPGLSNQALMVVPDEVVVLVVAFVVVQEIFRQFFSHVRNPRIEWYWSVDDTPFFTLE
jgi:hypothetical protein